MTIPMRPELQDLLAKIMAGPQLDYGTLMEAIHSSRFTGPLTVDFLNGVPRQINLGQPVKLSICQGLPADSGKGLDANPVSRAG